MVTGTSKAWLGQFGELGHPYSHPSTKQCNYSVDTSGFATTTQLNEVKTSVSNGKSAVASAITDKGVSTSATAEFATMATNIRNIPQLNTSDATATASQILSGYTAYVNGSKVTGNIASQAAQTITPGTTDQAIAAGKYLSGVQTIKGDANLIGANIRSGVSIFGVSGSMASGYTAVASYSISGSLSKYYADAFINSCSLSSGKIRCIGYILGGRLNTYDAYFDITITLK